MDNTQLPAEVVTEISKKAILSVAAQEFYYADGDWSLKEVAEREHGSGYELGAMEYATKLNQVEQERERLKGELDTAIRANENLTSRMQGWQQQLYGAQKERDTALTLLSKFISRHEAGLLPDRFIYNEIKQFLK